MLHCSFLLCYPLFYLLLWPILNQNLSSRLHSMLVRRNIFNYLSFANYSSQSNGQWLHLQIANEIVQCPFHLLECFLCLQTCLMMFKPGWLPKCFFNSNICLNIMIVKVITRLLLSYFLLLYYLFFN